ncbi:hypothetical protein [Micromonospora sp. RP3T]|uniref:hypothetical protein n=1 Tax=Micromonospora sp. RP3T TaxID=2135446 RepID=UPI0018EB975E|nr:hypothetical protein [Micromonospora sp. RP3T]
MHAPLAAGLADDVEIDAHLAAVEAGELDLILAPLISAWDAAPAERSAGTPPAGRGEALALRRAQP